MLARELRTELVVFNGCNCMSGWNLVSFLIPTATYDIGFYMRVLTHGETGSGSTCSIVSNIYHYIHLTRGFGIVHRDAGDHHVDRSDSAHRCGANWRIYRAGKVKVGPGSYHGVGVAEDIKLD